MAIYKQKHFNCIGCEYAFNVYASDDDVKTIKSLKCDNCKNDSYSETEIVKLDPFRSMWELNGESPPEIGSCNISSGVNMASKVPQGFREVIRNIKKNNPGNKIDGAL